MKAGDPIDELLSGGHLPARAYDEIFERVLAAAHPPPPRMPWWRRPWMLAPAGTLAVALGVWLIASPSPPQGTGFATKGGSRSAQVPAISVACGSLAGARCRIGDTMMFVVPPSSPGGYLVAYAERTEEPKGDRIWYFPDAAGRLPLVRGSGSTAVLEQGVKVGPEHRPGTYRIVLWLTTTAVERQAPAPAPQGAEGTVTTAELEIVP